jgi:hypothetical protein
LALGGSLPNWQSAGTSAILSGISPRMTRADVFAKDVTDKQELNRIAQTELARMREQWKKSISPDGRQLVGGLVALLVPTVLGVVLPVVALSMGPEKLTTPILVISYGFYVGLVVLFGYMFYLASRLIVGRERRMERAKLPLRIARRWVAMAATRLHLRRVR